MPDISMCANRTCASRMTCFRYRALPTPDRQFYGSFAPAEGAAKCDYFGVIYLNNKRLTPEEDLP